LAGNRSGGRGRSGPLRDTGKEGPGKVRIIGGRWRRRLVSFERQPGLRPTPDRVRETLFNWLAPLVSGTRCLDLYAGSGVLGFEALSRGAQRLLQVESNRAVVTQLKHQAQVLGADDVEVVLQDVLAFLRARRPGVEFDLVFVDPPYQDRLVTETCRLLEKYRWIAGNGLIYFESDTLIPAARLPAAWEIIRHKKAGAVHYCLACRTADTG